METITFILAALLTAFAGGLVFYNLLPMVTSTEMAEAVSKFKERLARKWKIVTRYGTELGGYVHDTHMSQFIPPNILGFSAGTWAMAVASNVWSNNRTAADASNTLYIPIAVPGNSVDLKGSYLTSVEIMYSIGTAAADDFATAKLYKDTLQPTAASGSGTLNTAAEVTTTADTGHDTAAERLAADEHRMVLTLTTPEWVDNDEGFHVELVIDFAATSVFKYFGAIANYTARL